MIRANIALCFDTGQTVYYANKKLVEKTGDDGAGSLKHQGRNGFFYAYTGSGDDTYADQTGKGKIKGDFEFFRGQIGGSGLLKFPEDGDTTELVRNESTTSKTFNRFSISASHLVSVTINEVWGRFPETDNRESGYMLPKDSRDFKGFQETKEITDRGPDFDAFKTFDNGFIPNPRLEIVEDELVIKNEKEYDYVVSLKEGDCYTAYGVINGKKSGTTFLRFK